jgi:nitroreductase/Pyruvate/2-oxoacid:ferredoxin oxidoreductase delta subunit
MTPAALNFQVDDRLCRHCGLCVSDCLARIITMEGTAVPGIPAGQEAACVDCQHCLAVCPEGAISIRGHRPGASRPLAGGALPGLEQMDLLVRSRRSVRQYRDANVDPDLVRRLLQTLEYTPTGVNCRKLTFTVIDDKAVMAQLRARVMDALVRALDAGRMPDPSAYLARMVGLWRDQGRDVIFQGAPHLLMVSTPADAPTPQQDVVLALAYFELLAQSAGLGTLWLGMLRRAFELLPDLKALLDLPADNLYYTMLFGYPAVQYARTVQREGGARIRKIKAIDAPVFT